MLMAVLGNYAIYGETEKVQRKCFGVSRPVERHISFQPLVICLTIVYHVLKTVTMEMCCTTRSRMCWTCANSFGGTDVANKGV